MSSARDLLIGRATSTSYLLSRGDLGGQLVTCNNEAEAKDVIAAVADERTLETVQSFKAMFAALSQIDVAKAAIAITQETGVNAGRGALAAEIGDLAEAEVASALAKDGLEIVHMNTEPNEKGIDIVAFDAKTGVITVFEVKSTLQPLQTQPQMGKTTKTGKQASADWVSARLRAAGLDNAKASDVSVAVVHVNLFNRTTQIFSVDEDGGSLTATSGPVAMEDAP
ncbi:MAG: hypothetical protein ACR2H2_01180 [Solirubrobacteraceae bacterium]